MPNRAKEVLFSWERLGWSMSIASHTVAMALPLKLMGNYLYIYIYIHIYIYIYIYISTQYMYYIWSRPAPGHPPLNAMPPAPPQQPLTGVASQLPPSVKISYAHMLYLHSGLVPPMHYITGYLHAMFITAYNMPIQSIYNVFLPIKYLYSSHMLATIKISSAIHTCLPRTTYTLYTWYLYNTPPIPQGGRG